jgi:heme exporter protein A
LTVLSALKLTCERDGRVLFEHLDLRIEAGDIIELRGANGSGKTTLLRCLAGLTTDFDGDVQRLTSLAYQGHRPGLNGLLSPLENLRWYAALDGSEGDDAALFATLAEVGLAGYELGPTQQLSAGQQRRVSLARLRMNPAALWILDEPLTALDPSGCEVVRDSIEGHASVGGAVLYATHQSLDLGSAQQLVLGGTA